MTTLTKIGNDYNARYDEADGFIRTCYDEHFIVAKYSTHVENGSRKIAALYAAACSLASKEICKGELLCRKVAGDWDKGGTGIYSGIWRGDYDINYGVAIPNRIWDNDLIKFSDNNTSYYPDSNSRHKKYFKTGETARIIDCNSHPWILIEYEGKEYRISRDSKIEKV